MTVNGTGHTSGKETFFQCSFVLYNHDPETGSTSTFKGRVLPYRRSGKGDVSKETP